jgi:hypothetical protein
LFGLRAVKTFLARIFLRSVVSVLEHDPKDGLAAALARLGRAFMARDS